MCLAATLTSWEKFLRNLADTDSYETVFYEKSPIIIFVKIIL